MTTAETQGSPLRIGLTGGIGSGKSTVALLLAEKGCAVLDADAIAHQLMSDPLGPVVLEIRSIFGDQVFDAEGGVRRDVLGRIVFENPERLRELESILHPAIRRSIERRVVELGHQGAGLVFIEVPLLFETGWDQWMDRSVVVESSLEVRLERLQRTRGMDREEALRRIDQQMSSEQRRSRADHVLANEGSRQDLEAEVRRVLAELTALGHSPGRDRVNR